MGMNQDRTKAVKEKIKSEIYDFVKKYEGQDDITTKWGTPLVGFANANHPFILNLKKLITPTHVMPADVLLDASIVLAYFIPFTTELAKTNTSASRLASAEWALAYEETNAMFGHLNSHIIEYLSNLGYKAAIAREAATFSTQKLISNWSHRHFAYAAGLGTFGINNMLITRSGCCGRFYTIVTNLDIAADEPMKEELCLYKKNGSCRICIKNCLVGALSESGYERKICYSMLKENAAIYTEFGSSYLDETGEKANSTGSEVCGKCVTSSPCAFYF
ncbi:MAG: epoxyqueuosine reductase [Firmicutes bacterium]|nr:epoxyqueuosine reductase [Bacillota bacterium]